MANKNIIEIEGLAIPDSQVSPVLSCLVNTIIFHRALGNHKVVEVDLENTTVTYPCVSSREIQKKIDDSIKDFTSGLVVKDKKDISFHLVFSVKVVEKGLWNLSESTRENEWEKWTIKFLIKENSRLDEDVTKKMNFIIHKAFEHSSLIPQLSQDPRVSIDGCFPFKFEYDKVSKGSFFQNLW